MFRSENILPFSRCRRKTSENRQFCAHVLGVETRNPQILDAPVRICLISEHVPKFGWVLKLLFEKKEKNMHIRMRSHNKLIDGCVGPCMID